MYNDKIGKISRFTINDCKIFTYIYALCKAFVWRKFGWLTIRNNATGTAGAATSVSNLCQILLGFKRLFYLVGHTKILVGFSSAYSFFQLWSAKKFDKLFFMII